MAAISVEDLENGFGGLSTQDSWNTDNARAEPGCLPFVPGADFESSRERAGHVDRYLWRLFDKRSHGSVDAIWVKSRGASRPTPSANSYKDVFAREDRSTAAKELARHLWGRKQCGSEADNFTSWCSSLLYVLLYAYYRIACDPRRSFDDMYICVVDRTKLPDGAFCSDLVLIEAFAPYDQDPTGEHSLSKLKDIRHHGKYYFGEYLSQGALQIEGSCAIVSMDNIVAHGLYHLREEFQTIAWKPEKLWARKTRELRRAHFRARKEGVKQPSLATDRELTAAWHIGMSFGSTWLLPVALAFLALKPRHIWDTNITSKFRPEGNSGEYLNHHTTTARQS